MTTIRMPWFGDEAPVQSKITRVCVQVGDEVEVDQELMEIENDKMSMSMCSHVKGTVVSVPAKLGDSVEAGADLVLLQTDLEYSGRPSK